jgi:hypothetical protein
VAAAVAIAALVLPRLAGDADTTTASGKAGRAAATTTAAPMIASGPAQDDSGASGPHTESATAGAPGTTTPGGTLALDAPFPVDLGAVPDLAGLADAARGELAAPRAAIVTPSPAEALEDCDAAVTAQAGADGRVVLRLRATVGSESALGVVVEHPDGRRTLAAAAIGGCRSLGTVEL